MLARMIPLRAGFAAIALCLPAAAAAQDVGGAWQVADGRVVLKAAKIALPQRAGPVGVTRTGEFSHKGESLDNVVQYQSADGAVFATAYVYRATYADAALTAYATDRAILSRFAGARVESEAVVPFAGQPRGAIRQVFAGAIDKDVPITTMAAFARVGSWIVKLRVTGPAARAADAMAALDALIAGTTVESDATVHPVSPLRIGAPCPATDAPEPRLLTGEEENAALLVAAVSGGSMIDAKSEDAPALAFPANGAIPACVRGRVATEAGFELLQPADQPQPAVMLMVLDDLGTTIAVEKSPIGRGYVVKRYQLGQMDVAGSLDRAPTGAQFVKMLTTKDSPAMAVRSTTTVTADGKSSIAMNAGSMK
jgi:hypothetical protein